MKLIFTSLFIFFTLLSFSQEGAYFSLGYGFSYGKGDLTNIQNSYTSYKKYASQVYSGDGFEDNGNWKSNQASPTFTMTAGYQIDGLLFDMSYHRSAYSQKKELIRNSGYGRSFLWEEERNEILVNVGYKFDKLSLLGGIGGNITHFTMASYQIYPDGTKSISSQFNFNGLFKGQDVGLSYSAAIKYYIFDFMNAELRYIYSSDKLIGTGEEFLGISDSNSDRTPTTSEYPQDYTKPLGFNNAVKVGVNRSYLLFTLSFELHTDNL